MSLEPGRPAAAERSRFRIATTAMIALPIAIILAGVAAFGLGRDKPEMEVLKVRFENRGDACEIVDFTADEKRVNKSESDQQILVVRVKNDCKGEARLRIVPKPLAPATNLPLKCTGQPVKANIGAQFGIDPNSKAFVICGVEYTKDAHKFVLKQPAASPSPATTLPAPPPPPPSADPTPEPSADLVAKRPSAERYRASELALEEVP